MDIKKEISKDVTENWQKREEALNKFEEEEKKLANEPGINIVLTKSVMQFFKEPEYYI